MVRVQRTRLLEKTVYTWLGLYPWVCTYCSKRLLLRKRG